MKASPIHPAALPNDLPLDELRIRPAADGSLAIDPARAGWRYLSFVVMGVGADAPIVVGGESHETVLVNLFGADVVVRAADREEVTVAGRPTVFDGLPSAFYLPAGHVAQVRADPAAGAAATLAIAQAPSRPEVAASLEPCPIGRDDIGIEIRGAGRSTREIHHIVGPAFPADRLLLVEVLTPAGNWSSWPPHKHDVDAMPGEAALEEVYHYRFRRPEAWAVQRLYRRPERRLPPRDGLWAVRDGEVILVPDGYHPFTATDADDAYYLNALAGDRRTMACSFDPDLDWVRERWSGEPPDDRLPFRPAGSGR